VRDKGASKAGGSAGDAPLWRARRKRYRHFHHSHRAVSFVSFTAIGANQGPLPKIFRWFAPIRSTFPASKWEAKMLKLTWWGRLKTYGIFQRRKSARWMTRSAQARSWSTTSGSRGFGRAYKRRLRRKLVPMRLSKVDTARLPLCRL
jgi:hypothetical protein